MELLPATLIVGASGGIGSALVDVCLANGDGPVYAASRTQTPSTSPSSDRLPPFDYELPASLSALARSLKEKLDGSGHYLQTICICTGLLHADAIAPERRLSMLDTNSFQQVMQVNALGPLVLLKQLLPLLPRRLPSRVLLMSARVGSISDNRLGGWYSYRCAKAALNQGVHTLAIELRRSHPLCVLTLFHPGTVDTNLSSPFQKGVAPERLFSVERAAHQLHEVLRSRQDPAAHLFVDWAGKPIPY